MIRTAIPNKGPLAADAAQLLRNVGLRVPNANDRKLLVDSTRQGYQVLFASPWDIPRYLQTGAADLGITGLDIVRETGNNLQSLLPLNFGFCRLSLAAPETSQARSSRDIPDGANVATSFPQLVRSYFQGMGKEVGIIEVRGAAEVTTGIGAADYIADLVETGSTLRMNHLKVVDIILESRAMLVTGSNRIVEDDPELRAFVAAIQSVLDAETHRYLMANVPVSKLPEIRSFLPGISGPTIMNLAGRDDMVALHVVVKVEEVDQVIARLKEADSTGILVVSIDRMVP
jgi:ATP phosphoribosyltransferase